MTYSNMTFGKKLLTISTLVISIWLVIGILIYRSTSFNSFSERPSLVQSSNSQNDEIEACLRNNQKLSPVFWRKVNLYQKEIPDSINSLASEINVLSNSTYYQESKVHFIFAKPKFKKNLSVLLLHGQSFTSDTWNKLHTLQNIAAFGYESIAIDIPGYGFSPVVQNLNKSEFLNSLIASLNLKNTVIVSPSMSGAFSLEYLINHYDKLAGFIPISPVGTQVLIRTPCAAQPNSTIDYFDRDCKKVLPYLNNRIPSLNCIKVPTLVVFGEKDPSKGSARLCHLPNSQGAEIPHGEHAAYLSNPKIFHRNLIPKCLNSCLTSGGIPPTNCFCDSKCSLIYNDCCLDAPYRTFRVTTKRNHNINCKFVHGENNHFWMVDTCKDTWSGRDHVREKCTNMVSGESDIIRTLPFTNPFEGVTYKNYYCALCNGEDTENLIVWQVKALCMNQGVTQDDILQNLTFVEDRQQWGVWKLNSAYEWMFHECHLLFERPPNVTSGVRHCVSGMVSTCPSGWKNIATRRKCKSYVDPVRWGDGPVYRNIDCAVCHNKTRTGFRCLYDVTRGSSAVMLNRALSVDLSCMGQWL